MDREYIKSELIRRAKAVPKESQNGNAIENLSRRLKGVEPFAEKMTEILNQILNEQALTFEGKEQEKEEFIEYLKPTVAELIKERILEK